MLRPAVSVAGNTAAAGGFTGSLPDAASFGAAGIDFSHNAVLDMQSTSYEDSYEYQGWNLAASPDTSNFGDDPLVGDFNDIDVTDFIDTSSFDNNTLPSIADASTADNLPISAFYTPSETQNPSKDSGLQPRLGASSYGCDDGGLAVGN